MLRPLERVLWQVRYSLDRQSVSDHPGGGRSLADADRPGEKNGMWQPILLNSAAPRICEFLMPINIHISASYYLFLI